MLAGINKVHHLLHVNKHTPSIPNHLKSKLANTNINYSDNIGPPSPIETILFSQSLLGGLTYKKRGSCLLAWGFLERGRRSKSGVSEKCMVSLSHSIYTFIPVCVCGVWEFFFLFSCFILTRDFFSF